MHRSSSPFATSTLSRPLSRPRSRVAVAAAVTVAALASAGALLLPAVASASPEGHSHAHPAATRVARVAKARPCAKPAVSLMAGAESATVSLAKCDGTANPAGVDQLSVLARPGSAPKPTESLAALGKTHGAELAPGIRRVDPRLVEHLQLAVDHFKKEGDEAHVVLVSGYRPRNSGSYHSSGRALDFRLEGVSNADLDAFCKTLPDTGCGYYPNSVFVHMDVRPAGTGHVAWTDVSHPGEAPRYVSPVAPSAEAKNDKPRKGAPPASATPETTTRESEGEMATHEKAQTTPDDVVAEKLPPLPKVTAPHRALAAAMIVHGST
jgi:hypothetical protein